MSVLDFVVHVAALVVAVAGVGKLIDPLPISTALSAAGAVGGPLAGRLIGATEMVIGAWVLVAGGRWSAAALAMAYLGFLGFIVTNRVRGLDVPCGCIGASTRPPGLPHYVLNALFAAVALAAVVWPVTDATGWLDHGAAGIGALGALVVAAGVTVVVLGYGSRSANP